MNEDLQIEEIDRSIVNAGRPAQYCNLWNTQVGKGHPLDAKKAVRAWVEADEFRPGISAALGASTEKQKVHDHRGALLPDGSTLVTPVFLWESHTRNS